MSRAGWRNSLTASGGRSNSVAVGVVSYQLEAKNYQLKISSY